MRSPGDVAGFEGPADRFEHFPRRVESGRFSAEYGTSGNQHLGPGVTCGDDEYLPGRVRITPDPDPDVPEDRCACQVVERLAVSSYLIGDDARCAAMWEEAHRRHAEADDPAGAALCSFWLAFSMMMRGQMARAAAWLGRTEAVLASVERCRASGYVLIPALLQALDADDPAMARTLAAKAADVAETFEDPDLAALAQLGDGQALMMMGDTHSATARFDSVMLMVSTGEVGPVVAGSSIAP